MDKTIATDVYTFEAECFADVCKLVQAWEKGQIMPLSVVFMGGYYLAGLYIPNTDLTELKEVISGLEDCHHMLSTVEKK